MKTRIAALAVSTLLASSAFAAQGKLNVTVDGQTSGATVPEANLLCKPTDDGKSTGGTNLRPSIHWTGAPKGTKSFAVFMMDPDVPADFSDAGKEGKIIAKDAKRQDFFHYGVVNIPASVNTLAGGDSSQKPAHGTELVNDLGSYVPSPTQFGGPCPPWNDARMHHYHFMVLALDDKAPIDAPAATDCNDPACKPDTAKNTFNRLIASKHVLAKGTVMGTYSLNPSLQK